MTGPLRSKQGCWTCRLRKKKCDERRLSCSICEALSIPCYGYGPKPSWMDDGEKEKAIVYSLKEIVKRTSRQKATAQISCPPSSPIHIAPKTSVSAVEKPAADVRASRNASVDALSASLPWHENVFAVEDLLPRLAPATKTESSLQLSADDSTLLMYYLDYLFPLQYPLYRHGPGQERGWLLSLLLRSRSLYHGALAISAYHRRVTVSPEPDHRARAISVVQEEQHLEICIRALNEATQNSCPNSGVAMALSVLQLCFYELFTQGVAWQAHFQAALSIYHRMTERDTVQVAFAETTNTPLPQATETLGDTYAITEEVLQFRFLTCMLFLLDTILSITAGTAPRISLHWMKPVAGELQNKTGRILHCEDSVLLQIGRIASLSEYKIRTTNEGTFDCIQYARNVDEIRREVQRHQTDYALNDLGVSGQDLVDHLRPKPALSRLVTGMFAHMASVYLHLVINGFGNLDSLDTTMAEALELFHTCNLYPSLAALVICPLFMFAIVATPDTVPFFRTTFSSLPLLDPALQHRHRILPILDKIWERRRSTSDFGWKEILDLTHDILLV